MFEIRIGAVRLYDRIAHESRAHDRNRRGVILRGLCTAEQDDKSLHLMRLASTRNVAGSVALAAFVAGCSRSAPLPRAVEPLWDDIHPAVSPDGRSVAFSSNRSGAHHIYVLERRTGAVRQLTRGAGANYWPSWSPEGTRLVFDSDRSGDQELFVVDLAGGIERRLTADPAHDAVSAWAPRGDVIAFDSNRRPDSAADIWLARSDGSEQRALWSDSSSDGHPNWSPDARFIAFKTGPLRGTAPRPSEIAVVEVSTGTRRIVTRNGGTNVHPSWSPDGTRLFFISRRGGSADVRSIRPDGNDERAVTRGGGDKQRPTVAPDGYTVVYAARGTRRWSLWVHDLRDGSSRPLGDFAQADVEVAPRPGLRSPEPPMSAYTASAGIPCCRSPRIRDSLITRALAQNAPVFLDQLFGWSPRLRID